MIVWGSIFNSLLIANDMLDDMAKMSLFSVQKIILIRKKLWERLDMSLSQYDLEMCQEDKM